MARKLRKYEIKLAKEILREKQEKKQIFRIYKDVMSAVSQGKFSLVDEQEFAEYIKSGTIIGEQLIEKPEDVGACPVWSKTSYPVIHCGCSELLELLERIYLKSNEKGATLVLEHTRG